MQIVDTGRKAQLDEENPVRKNDGSYALSDLASLRPGSLLAHDQNREQHEGDQALCPGGALRRLFVCVLSE